MSFFICAFQRNVVVRYIVDSPLWVTHKHDISFFFSLFLISALRAAMTCIIPPNQSMFAALNRCAIKAGGVKTVQRLFSMTENDNMSVVVDSLLSNVYNEYFEEDANRAKLHTVAYSGGVDSSLVAYLLHRANATATTNRVQAVLGVSPALSAEQRNQAHTIAKFIGIEFSEVETSEGRQPLYIENTGQACYACKTTLYSTLQSIYDSQEQHELYNGTNRDDLKDSTRVGLLAAAEFKVHSPIQHLNKAMVRAVAQHVGLPNAHSAASPCLRSRLQLGVPALSHHLNTIEKAERFVREQLYDIFAGDDSVNLRVRFLANQRARIEIDESYVNVVLDHRRNNQELWDGEFITNLGFRHFDVAPFKTGSVAKA